MGHHLDSKENVGLDVASISVFSKAQLQKWHSYFLKDCNAFWVKFVKAIHGTNGEDDLEWGIHHNKRSLA